MEAYMGPRLADQLTQVQKDLARSITAAEHIGESLVELGTRLRRDPGKWAIDWLDDAFLGAGETLLIERELVEALDRNRLEWLLEDIRILRRREAELRRLMTDQPLYQTATG
jgi:hypothetical protein